MIDIFLHINMNTFCLKDKKKRHIQFSNNVEHLKQEQRAIFNLPFMLPLHYSQSRIFIRSKSGLVWSTFKNITTGITQAPC